VGVVRPSLHYVDRFGLLLLVTAVAAITLSLVDLESVEGSLTSQLSDVLVSVFVGATLLLALRAWGVGRQFRTFATSWWASVCWEPWRWLCSPRTRVAS
jgi:hypothetical protein